jgi:hypothetical protein
VDPHHVQVQVGFAVRVIPRGVGVVRPGSIKEAIVEGISDVIAVALVTAGIRGVDRSAREDSLLRRTLRENVCPPVSLKAANRLARFPSTSSLSYQVAPTSPEIGSTEILGMKAVPRSPPPVLARMGGLQIVAPSSRYLRFTYECGFKTSGESR